jgi:hypothetical protein
MDGKVRISAIVEGLEISLEIGGALDHRVPESRCVGEALGREEWRAPRGLAGRL